MNASLLAVQDVSHRFRQQQVLRRVSFQVRAGEVVGIVGENGSGKTTLLRITVGLLRPSAGRVTVAGRLGYCDQDPQLFRDLTVDEHFTYFARAYGLADTDAWRSKRDELLERFNFARQSHARIATLSAGTRHKLHLSLALLHRPNVLVLDEPFAAFDWDTYLHFWDYTEALRGEGAAVVIVSHLAYERERFTRILELRGGELACA